MKADGLRIPSGGLPLDPSLYQPTKDGIEILKKLTGIRDDDDLRKHAMEVQAELYAVCTLLRLPPKSTTNPDHYRSFRMISFVILHS